MPLRPAVFLLLAAAVIAGCRSEERGLRIVVLADLTGPHAEAGQGLRTAAALALAENREALAEAGWRVELAAFDASGSARDLADAVTRITLDPDTVCAVVHTDTEGVFLAVQILNAAGIPTVLPLETAPLPAGGGFAEAAWLSADDRMHGAAGAEWAAGRAFTRIFLLMDPDPHAAAVGEAFRLRAEELGLSVVEFPLPPEGGESGWLPSLAAADPFLVYFSGSPGSAVGVLRGLESLSFDGSFLFAESEGEDRLPEDLFSETVSLFFSPAVEHSENFSSPGEFAERYRAAYGTDPPDLSSLGYDAAGICLSSLLESDLRDGAASALRDRILSLWGSGWEFPGTVGTYSPGRGRTCRLRIFSAPADSGGAWTLADAQGGADPACRPLREEERAAAFRPMRGFVFPRGMLLSSRRIGHAPTG